MSCEQLSCEQMSAHQIEQSVACHRKTHTFNANVADGVTDGQKNNVALAHPYYVGKLCSKLVKFCPVILEEIA